MEKTNSTINKAVIKKYAVIACMSLLCGGCIWWIYAPSATEKEKTAQETGLNMTIPDPSQDEIMANKKDAYERFGEFGRKSDQLLSLEKYSETLGNKKEEFPQIEEVVKVPEPLVNPVASSVEVYSNIGKTLDNFYQPVQQDNSEELLELTWRIQQLERRLEESNTEKDLLENQFQMLERSYELAAKYFPNNGAVENLSTSVSVPVSQATTTGTGNNPSVKSVGSVKKQLVSLLAPSISDSAFIEMMNKPRNLGFHTVAGSSAPVSKNTILACVHQTITVTNGGEVPLRLLEPIQIEDVVIPEHTIVIGQAQIRNDRMNIHVSAVEHAGSIYPVSMQAYDNYGMAGVAVPGSEEVNALKEVLAGAGNNLGSTITVTQGDALEQLGTDLGRGLIQGTSQYMSRKLREVKVTIKANHQLLLMPTS